MVGAPGQVRLWRRRCRASKIASGLKRTAAAPGAIPDECRRLGQCRLAARRGVARKTRPHRDLETTRRRARLRGAAQSGRRWTSRPGGHGGEQRALMVYQLDSYRHWADHLGRSDFVHGNFGENLTVDGLADTEVFIGDRYRIGGAIFEVSQPRVTCYRLGLRLNHPEMPALVVAHRRPGFYFRVIEEGEIGAGDRIEKIAEGPERMSVAEIDSLLYSADHPVEALRRATRIPALSPGWQRSIKALLDAAARGDAAGNAGLSPASATPPRLARLSPSEGRRKQSGKPRGAIFRARDTGRLAFARFASRPIYRRQGTACCEQTSGRPKLFPLRSSECRDVSDRRQERGRCGERIPPCTCSSRKYHRGQRASRRFYARGRHHSGRVVERGRRDHAVACDVARGRVQRPRLSARSLVDPHGPQHGASLLCTRGSGFGHGAQARSSLHHLQPPRPNGSGWRGL
jgi:MOSC domain-containing protein YiiM